MIGNSERVSQHESVRTLISDLVKELRDDITFSYSRQSDFNSLSDKNEVCVHLDPLKWTPLIIDTSIHKNWSVAMFFFKQGQRDDTEEQFVPMLDETADLVERFLALINNEQTYTISSISAEPAIKVTAEVLTGWIVTLTLTTPDTFDYCTVYDS